MYFKFNTFLTKSALLGALFLSSISHTIEAEELNTFRFKIIDKTTNKDLAVSKVSFPQGAIEAKVTTRKEKDATYGSMPIKVGRSSLIPGIYIFAITHEKTSVQPLYMYVMAYKENQNDTLMIVLSTEFNSDTSELIFETNKATITTATQGRENPIYDATLVIDNQNINKSKILSLTVFQKERANILGIIKELAPSLYQEIIAVDPNGGSSYSME